MDIFVALIHIPPVREVNIFYYVYFHVPLSLPHSAATGNQASRAQRPEGRCFIRWQRLINVWQAAKLWDVLHESSTNTPPWCRYAFAHVSIRATWEVCTVCLQACVCVWHAGLCEKSPECVHLIGTMGWWRWPSWGSRAAWWGRRMWDNSHVESKSSHENRSVNIHWLDTHTHTHKTPFPVFRSPSHRNKHVSERANESKGWSPAWALNVTVSHCSLPLSDADREPFWLPHQSSQGVKNIYMQIRMTHWLLWAR